MNKMSLSQLTFYESREICGSLREIFLFFASSRFGMEVGFPLPLHVSYFDIAFFFFPLTSPSQQIDL